MSTAHPTLDDVIARLTIILGPPTESFYAFDDPIDGERWGVVWRRARGSVCVRAGHRAGDPVDIDLSQCGPLETPVWVVTRDGLPPRSGDAPPWPPVPLALLSVLTLDAITVFDFDEPREP